MEFYQYGNEVSDSDIAPRLRDSKRFPIQTGAWRKTRKRWSSSSATGSDQKEATRGCQRGWRDQALNFLERLTPQQRGKIRQEFLRLEKQILTEMEEVRRWNRKFAILASIQSIPHQRIWKRW